MIDTYCETCGKQFRARNLNVIQCADHTGQETVQDVVEQIKHESDQWIYDLKIMATTKLRSLSFKDENERHQMWRHVKACDRELVRRELPSLQPDTLTRIKRMMNRGLRQNELPNSNNTRKASVSRRSVA